MAVSVNSTVIARLASAVYGYQLGMVTMGEATLQATAMSSTGADGVALLMNQLYQRDFGMMATADVAATVVGHLGVPSAKTAEATAYVKAQLDGASAANRGKVLTDVVNMFSSLAGSTNAATADYKAAAQAFNAQVERAITWAKNPFSTDVLVSAVAPTFTLTPADAAGADVMRLTGNMNARIDFTNPANQVRGLDLDGDGIIEINGIENVSSNFPAADRGADYEIVDAYARNPLNQTDSANNFLGDIYFDGTGFDGDGVSTDGNIYLGGLGIDIAFGGIGNDFMAGGNIAQSRLLPGGGLLPGVIPAVPYQDKLYGGRNADFFYAESSDIDLIDGDARLYIDGGITADDTAAFGGTNSAQNSDWLLFEGTDDHEPYTVNMALAGGFVRARSADIGQTQVTQGTILEMDEIENFDASGNLYGFLDDMDIEIGGRGYDDRDKASSEVGYNYGLGSSGQLEVTGNGSNNIIIAGYDNDVVFGGGGSDLLFGGNLNFLNNPNLAGIKDNGMDELYGQAGDDNLVWEADGGIYDGGGDAGDTLWLTREAFGKRTATELTTDGRVRIDLAVANGSLASAAGYGGADKNYVDTTNTGDQTNYTAAFQRTKIVGIKSVVTTGLGGVDYLAAGDNDPELNFANQQNHFAFSGDLDLRGDGDANTLYAVGGQDNLEGRAGNDKLSGGGGNDDFYFFLQASTGDGVDVIHRQTDANGDNLWDGTFERDFNIGGSSTTGSSSLTVDLGATDLSSADVALTSFSIKIGGTTFAVTDSAALIAATSAAGVAALVNTAFKAQDSKVTAVAVGNTIVVTDTGGRDISDTVAEGYAVGGVVSNGAFSAQATFAAAGVTTTRDRIIYKSYEDRLDNEGVDDDSVLGSTISLGTDAYAEDLVIWFGDEDGDGAASTRIAEDQAYRLNFTNLTTQDRVTVTVNGVKYTLQVGVGLDGEILATEDGATTTDQDTIQENFLARLVAFIDSFQDDDTSAGKVDAALTLDVSGETDRITLTQVAYNGEETVFMTRPTVTLSNLSGGEPASSTVTNNAQHELELLDFDGRNGELNKDNVLFWGQESVSRAILQTGKTAGGTITGSEATVIDVGPNNLQDVVFGTTTAVPNNIATNGPLSTTPNGVAVHGDDFLLGGAGNDVINGGTGDDRVEGSAGTDAVDGGKNFYAIQVLGEPQARVYILNKWEAANPTKVTALSGLTISSITLINQSESGVGTTSGVFDDTLQFSQANFTSGTTRFTVTLNDFAMSGTTVELRNDGAGTVGVDADGNGTIDSTTTFKNFENIRTVSGTSNAVAGDGQGNDTLDVVALSNLTTGAGGVSYNLTNAGTAGEVKYSADTFMTLTPAAGVGTSSGDRPAAADYEALVLKVDGVENVSSGTGHDLLLIDETEGAKNNTFSAGLGVDRIEYQDDYVAAAVDGVAQPSVRVAVNTATDTDTVTMKSGRVGTLNTTSGGAVDTLVGVEYIGLGGEVAQSSREDDVLDVTAMVSGAVVDYTNGEVRTGAAAGSGVQVVIEGMVQLETVLADGNDTVIVADAAVMNTNARSDEGVDATAAKNILFMTYRDFDELNTSATTRKSFAAQVVGGTAQQVINQGQFTFSLSEVGTDADTDRVDYSNEAGRIVVPVGQGSATMPQYVVVDGDNDQSFSDGESRVDALKSVEEIVAAKGVSVMDFTAVGQARQITFQYNAPSSNPAENGTLEQTIRIADGNGNTIAGLNAFVERYTYNKTTAAVADATWNQIEGSDAAEVVIYQGSEDLVNQAGLDHRFTTDTLTLRGGNNEVRYSPLETSISASINVVEEDPLTTSAAEGLITATVTFQDGQGVSAPSATFLGGTHTITSHTSDNATAAGNLKIEGSQDAEDVVSFTTSSTKTFILGVSAGVINVNIGALSTMVLTGFEFLQDASTNDVYDVRSISATAGLKLLDNDDDHDAIKVANDAVNYNGSGANTIDLDNLSATVGGYNFDFDVLDLTNLTSALTGLTVNGGTDALPVETDANEIADNTDEVVLGALARVSTINDFEAMVLTEASVAAGAVFTFNPAANTLVQGSTTVSTTADELSFSGLVREQTAGFGRSYVAAATTAVNVTIAGATGGTVHGGAGADTITGSNAADVIRGAAGADTLTGGVGVEVRQINIQGILDGAAGGVVTATFTGGAATTVAVTEGTEIVVGAGNDAVGAALATKILANLAAVNTAAAWNGGALLTGVSYSADTDLMTFTFTPGINVTGTIAITDTDASATFGASAETVVTDGGNGGADRFVFEATATANGADTINNVTIGAGGDVFDFSAFFGAASTLTAGFVTYASGAPNGALTNGAVQIVVNKGTLSSSDIALAAANGKFTLVNNGKAVVITTADADGTADATNNAYNVYYVQDTDSTGAQSYAVTLVATLNSDSELAAGGWLLGNLG